MAEFRSALAGHFHEGRQFDGDGPAPIILSEVTGCHIVQIATWPDQQARLGEKLQADLDIQLATDPHLAHTRHTVTSFMVAPARYWLVGAFDSALAESLTENCAHDEACITDLSHSQTIIFVKGPRARELLNRGIAVDLHPDKFPPGAFARTACQNFPIMLHHVSGENVNNETLYHCYVPRSYALSLWQEFTVAAASLGYEVRATP